ncbi:MAG: SDR family oxidoreductase [Acidobacteriota bacterium]
MTLQLVTGGAGFIGSHLTERLLSQGHDVRVVDDFSTGKRENLRFPGRATGWGRLEVMEGDLTDPGTARRAVRQVEHVFHQAAIPSVPRSVADPAATNQANVGGTLNLMLAARDAGVRRFVYASSSSLYGDTPELPKVETMPPRPQSPYAVSKLACEQYAQVFHRLYGLPTVGLRYFNVFGPRQDPGSQYAAVVPKFIVAIASSRPPTIFGDGHQTRDFTYVGNVVEANLLASASGERALGGSFNIACGRRISLLDLVAIINGIFESSIEPVHEAARPGDVRHSLADVSASEEMLGYRPTIEVQEGLVKTAEWFAKRR